MEKKQKEIIKMIKNNLKATKFSKEESKEYFKQVYSLYGSEVYRKVTPKNIQKQDKKELLRSGRFLDIYEKYGEKEYSKYIDYMESKDVENETNSKFKGTVNKLKNFIRNKIISPLMSGVVVVAALPPSYEQVSKIDMGIEYLQNKEVVEEYLNNIEDYAKTVKKMNLPDLEVIMKVTDDMWKSIDGYKVPESELIYYRGVSLEQDKIGVCRHMADDTARKLNAINPEYNARSVAVYFKETDKGAYTIADIPIRVVPEENESVSQGNENTAPSEKTLELIGNHAVVLLDIKEDNATLVLDPTNPGIGVLKDGKITMFNANPEIFSEELTFLGNAFINSADIVGISAQFISSFKNTNLSIEELEKKYGLEAQNIALKAAREKSKLFKDTVKVEISTGQTLEIDFSNQSENKDYLKNDEER